MKRTRNLAPLALFLLAPFLVSCRQDSSLENAGEQVDDTLEDVGDSLEDAADEVEDLVDGNK